MQLAPGATQRFGGENSSFQLPTSSFPQCPPSASPPRSARSGRSSVIHRERNSSRTSGQSGAPAETSWERVATWYDGWVGDRGSAYHRQLAIPATLDLLQPQPGEEVLDVGGGQGVATVLERPADADSTVGGK